MSDRRWERNASRIRLVAAALDAVSHEGPAAVSGRAVARSARVHHVQIQQMFGSVGALLTHAVVDERDRFVADVFGDPISPPSPIAIRAYPEFWRSVAQTTIDPGPIDLGRLFEGGPLSLVRQWMAERQPESRPVQLDGVAAAWVAAPLGALVFQEPLQRGLGISNRQWPSCWARLGQRISQLVEDPDCHRHHVRSRPRWEPGPRREAAPHSSREKLVVAAVDLLATRLEAGVTGRELAAAAGVSHGLLGHHFESKQAVFDEALHLLHRRFLDDMLTATGDEAEFALAGHRTFIRAWASRILTDRPTPPFELLGMQQLVDQVTTSREIGNDADRRLAAVADAMTAVALRLGWTLAQPLLARVDAPAVEVTAELVAIDRWLLRDPVD